MAIVDSMEIEINAHIKISESDALACAKILEIYLTNNEHLKLEYARDKNEEAIIRIKERKMEIEDLGDGSYIKKYLD